MHRFHLVLTNGEQKDHKAANHRVGMVGELIYVAEGLTDDKDPAAIIYAPGTWVKSELELHDDKG